jgi:hypothetical protein
VLRAVDALANRERAPQEGLSHVQLPEVPVGEREIVQEHRHPGVIRPQRLLPDPERAPVERLGLRGLTLRVTGERERVETVGHRGVVRTERPLAEHKTLPGQLLRLGEAPFHPVDLGEVVQA